MSETLKEKILKTIFETEERESLWFDEEQKDLICSTIGGYIEEAKADCPLNYYWDCISLDGEHFNTAEFEFKKWFIKWFG